MAIALHQQKHLLQAMILSQDNNKIRRAVKTIMILVLTALHLIHFSPYAVLLCQNYFYLFLFISQWDYLIFVKSLAPLLFS